MTNIKNIILIYPSFERGGVENIIKNLIYYFTKKKYFVYLISNVENKKIFKYRKGYFNLIKLKKTNLKGNFKRAFLSFKSQSYLIKLFKNLNKKNSIIYSMQSNILSIVVSKLFNYKIVVRNSENPISSYIFSKNRFYSLLIITLKFLFYRFSDGIVTNSIGSRIDLKKIVGKKILIKTIYNPYISHIKKYSYRNKKNYILSTGRLTFQKDYFTLIDAFKKFSNKYKNYKLYILGDGPLKKDLINYARNLNLEKKIFFKGWINKTNKFYNISKIFVLSSLYEGLGNVLIDAINYNLPCISTDCRSGPSEILLSGKGGELFEVKNPEKLYYKLIYIHKNYKSSMKKTYYAKKKLNRFLISNGSENHLKFFSRIIKR